MKPEIRHEFNEFTRNMNNRQKGKVGNKLRLKAER
jgi:hypothetical protein